jgi:hypothetical protein
MRYLPSDPRVINGKEVIAFDNSEKRQTDTLS